MGRLKTFAGAIAGLAGSYRHMQRVIAVTAIALLVLSALMIGGFMRAAAHVDQLDRDSQRRLLANHLIAAGETNSAAMGVQLRWDDALNATDKRVDAAWTDTFLGRFFWDQFEQDATLLVASDGTVLRRWEQGKALAPASRPNLDWVPALIARAGTSGPPVSVRQGWPFDRRGLPMLKAASSVAAYNGQPAIVSAVSVLPDVDFAKLRREPRYVIGIELLDPHFLAQAGKKLELQQPHLDPAAAQGNFENGLALIDPLGRRLGSINWTTVPFNESLRKQVQPLFALNLALLFVLIGGGAIIFSTLWRALRELSTSEALAQHTALHDAMTGLPNRAHFFQTLTGALETLHGEDGARRVYVAYFDIDRFKSINDTMGHHVGDELVRLAALRLQERLPHGDFVARLGGDEFVVIRTRLDQDTAGEQLGADIKAVMAEPFDVYGKTIDVTVSCGIAWAPEHSNDTGDLLRNADIAMYRAKQAGRARWRVFTPEMDEAVRWRHEVEIELRQAIARNLLDIAYQPIVDARSGAIEGVEALLRWDHPVRGTISPSVFVPVAEQSGMMAALGWWVLDRVFDECKAWPELDVSINLSPLQLGEPQFVAQLESLLARHGVSPDRFTFEITENVMLVTTPALVEVLRRIRALGFRIALDDFGSGYSSLSYLRSFEFDQIKIDRTFVQNIEFDLDALSILKAIASLGQTLRMNIVAEGVESPLQQQLVRAAGCDRIQGHLYWDALAPDQLDDLCGRPAPEPDAVEPPARRRA